MALGRVQKAGMAVERGYVRSYSEVAQFYHHATYAQRQYARNRWRGSRSHWLRPYGIDLASNTTNAGTGLCGHARCDQERMYVTSLSSDQPCRVPSPLTSIGTCWNGGEFYGPPDYNSLVLLERYLEKYPEDADKIVLNIKGGANPKTHQVDASPENTRRTLDDCIAQLKGRKKIDMFEFGRRDPAVPLDVTFGLIEKEYIQTGKIGGIALSEVRAETIHEAVKHTNVVAVEAELSLYVILAVWDFHRC